MALFRKQFGNEQFCYHGTTRKCQLGENGNNQLCTDSTCPTCNILKTSFNVAFARASGGFGAGIYSSTASSKASAYTRGRGVMFVTKVVVGKPYHAPNWGQPKTLPAGHNSVRSFRVFRWVSADFATLLGCISEQRSRERNYCLLQRCHQVGRLCF